jgi:uncharacterized protein (DUF1697 family)
VPATHAALLRGINVGKAKRISMADLRALVEGLGYADVRTLLNSGNVAFAATAAALKRGDPAARIERALAAQCGVDARVTVLAAAELAALLAKNPLAREAAREPSRFLVAVLRDPADRPRLAALAREDWTPEAIALGPRGAYLWCPDGILGGRLVTALDRALKEGVTSRNWATMLKLEALLGA